MNVWTRRSIQTRNVLKNIYNCKKGNFDGDHKECTISDLRGTNSRRSRSGSQLLRMQWVFMYLMIERWLGYNRLLLIEEP